MKGLPSHRILGNRLLVLRRIPESASGIRGFHSILTKQAVAAARSLIYQDRGPKGNRLASPCVNKRQRRPRKGGDNRENKADIRWIRNPSFVDILAG